MARQPYLSDPDVTLWQGDCLEVLRELPERSVDMIATSPPFYGLRDYGTGTWEGGNPDCDHAPEQPDPILYDNGQGQSYISNNQNWNKKGRTFAGNECPKCGARRVDQQIGLEETPDQWVDRLVAVFRECRRVLADHGTLWIEIGDSYASGTGAGTQGENGQRASRTFTAEGMGRRPPRGVKPKDLLGQPWMLAFALRADGWYLRSEIIWARPNPMPESVTDRPTKSHSTVFMLSKRPRYFWDADAIREVFSSTNGSGNQARKHGVDVGVPGARPGDLGRSIPWQPPTVAPQAETLDGSIGESPRGPDGRRQTAVTGQENSEQHRDGERWPNPSGANARSVWTIPTEPTPFAHFATWPQALVRRMILAGTSEMGVCPECRAPWARQVVAEGGSIGRDWNQRRDGGKDDLANGASARKETVDGTYRRRYTGWERTCVHEHDAVPAVVLDPFAGSGTTLLVARQLGRHAVGIELNPEYCELAGVERLAQQSLFTELV